MKDVFLPASLLLAVMLGVGWWMDHRFDRSERERLLAEVAHGRAMAEAVASREPPAARTGLSEAATTLKGDAINAPSVIQEEVDVRLPAPTAPAANDTPPSLNDEQVGAIEQFDVAMDREFDRLEAREQSATDPGERETIEQLKSKLLALDALYRRADTVTDPAERMQIQIQMQQEMGAIIGLTRRDRNERLGQLATHIGYTDPQAIERFIQEVDRIYYETHMDWTKLFNRAPPGGP